MPSNNHTENVRNMAERLLENSFISKLPVPYRSKEYLAFTLAEVLITLVIIGTVAALTIPDLVQGIQKEQFVTKLKKEYSVLEQAYLQIVADSGGSILNNPDFNCSGDDTVCRSTASANAMNAFLPKLIMNKNCGVGTGCWYSSTLKYLGGTAYSANLDTAWNSAYGKAILADGSITRVRINNSNCSATSGTAPSGSRKYQTVCGNIVIDVNGAAGPNQIGKDTFAFDITTSGIYPFGTYGDGYTCDINSSTEITSWGCTGKVLKESAMNY